MKLLSGIVLLAVYASGCTSNHSAGEQPAASSLTSIDVTLPAKDKLPAGLNPENLYYCFSINNAVPAYELGTPDCTMPVYSESHFRSGKYESQLNLDGKLKSDKSWAITLLIGYKMATGSGQGTVSAASEAMSASAYAPDRASVEAAASGNSDVIIIDSGRPFYQGFAHLTPADLAGKSKIDVMIELQGFGVGSEDLPAQITTEGSDVDVKVEAVFKDPSAVSEEGPY